MKLMIEKEGWAGLPCPMSSYIAMVVFYCVYMAWAATVVYFLRHLRLCGLLVVVPSLPRPCVVGHVIDHGGGESGMRVAAASCSK